jgi:hypothetical protein
MRAKRSEFASRRMALRRRQEARRETPNAKDFVRSRDIQMNLNFMRMNSGRTLCKYEGNRNNLE